MKIILIISILIIIFAVFTYDKWSYKAMFHRKGVKKYFWCGILNEEESEK